MRKQYLECGKIVSTHGIYGEVRVQPWCDGPEVLAGLEKLYFDKGETPVEIERCRAHGNVAVMKLRGSDSIEDAARLRDRVLYLNRDDMAMEPGEYFVQDLIGCKVIDADTGADYGEVYDCRPTGANDVYYLRDAQGVERLVPAIDSVVLERDIEGGLITIRPLEGLFDD